MAFLLKQSSPWQKEEEEGSHQCHPVNGAKRTIPDGTCWSWSQGNQFPPSLMQGVVFTQPGCETPAAKAGTGSADVVSSPPSVTVSVVLEAGCSLKLDVDVD